MLCITTLFLPVPSPSPTRRSSDLDGRASAPQARVWTDPPSDENEALAYLTLGRPLSSLSGDQARQVDAASARSEEHTSELQSPCNLVCRLLLEQKNRISTETIANV